MKSKTVMLSVNCKEIDKAAKKVSMYAKKLSEAIKELEAASGSMTITEAE